MEEFALCWNNFSENLATGFQNLLDRGNLLVDCTLACEGKLLRAHKIVLAICSPYFQEMFVSNPCKHPIIILKDVSYGIMSELLQFMYQGEVNVKQSELQQFMKIAETLQIKGLTTSSSSNSTSKDGKTNHSTNTSPSAEHKTNQGAIKRSHTATEESPKKPQTKRPNIEEPEINAENIDQLASEEVFLPQITMVESRFDMSHVKRENNNDIPTSSPQSPNSIIRNNFVNSVTNQMNPGPPPNFNFEYPNELHSQNDYKAATSGYIDPIAGASITMLSSTSLLHGNCIFNRNNTVATQQGMKTYWLCKSYRITMCRARCITHQGRVISATGVHNHPAHMNVKNQEIPPTGPPHHNNSSSQSPPHNPYVQQPPPNMPPMPPQSAQHGLHHPGQLMHYPHFPHHHMSHHQPPMMNPQMMQEMNMNAPPNLQITPIGTVNMNPSVSQANNEMLGNLNMLRSMHQPSEKHETPQTKQQDQSIQSVDLCSSSPTSNQSHSPQSSHNQSTDSMNNSSTRQHGHDDILVLSPHDNSIQSSFKIEHNL